MTTLRRRVSGLTAALLACGLAVAGCSQAGGTGAENTDPAATEAAPTGTEPSLDFTGPNGEKPSSLDELTLTDEEVAKVKEGKFKAAFVWHENSSYVQAVEKGARAEFDKLGIEVVATTEAGFDAARQADNVQTVMALDPDIIVTIAVDPTSAAAAFQPAVDKGVKIAVMTTPPAGYTAGKEFVSIVTGALTEYGRDTAQMLADSLDKTGEVGYIYHDADFWFTNQRDAAFKNWIGYLAPDMGIVNEQGFTDPARTEDIANAMITKNPDIKGIYVAWATAADGVLSALRNAGRTDVKVVTNDLDENLAADMMRDGIVCGLEANGATSIGTGLALVGAYGVLDKAAPELVASHPVAVTKDTVTAGWQAEYATDPPASVMP